MTSTTTTASPVMIAVFIGIFAIVIIFVIVMTIRRREIAFDGEVIDKNIIENRGGVNINNGMNDGLSYNNNPIGSGVTHTYKIKVKTTSGKTINYKISSGMYETVKIGDNVSKPKGTTEITINTKK